MTTADVELLQAADRVGICYRRWQPEGECRGTVQIVHGASEHSARYDPDVGSILDDVSALHRVLADEHPGVRRVLLGHSMGSIIALAAAERDGGDLSGLVLSGPIGVAPGLAESVPALEGAVAAGMDDQPLDARHEVFNETNRDETNRDEVTEDLTTWIDQRLG